MEFENLEVRRYHPTETGIAYIVPVSDEEGYGTTEVAVSYLADPNGNADNKQRAAYAQLFAASPDLLDACKQFIAATRVGDNYEINNSRIAALQAIAKAEGKS